MAPWYSPERDSIVCTCGTRMALLYLHTLFSYGFFDYRWGCLHTCGKDVGCWKVNFSYQVMFWKIVLLAWIIARLEVKQTWALMRRSARATSKFSASQFYTLQWHYDTNGICPCLLVKIFLNPSFYLLYILQILQVWSSCWYHKYKYD